MTPATTTPKPNSLEVTTTPSNSETPPVVKLSNEVQEQPSTQVETFPDVLSNFRALLKEQPVEFEKLMKRVKVRFSQTKARIESLLREVEDPEFKEF